MIHGSWTYCELCKSLMEVKLFPRFAKRPEIKTLKSCTCVEHRYPVPKYHLIDVRLKGLSNKEILALRPLDIHSAQYVRFRNGYRQKTDKFRATWSSSSVQDKINDLEDEDSRDRCQNAYDYLMTEEKSSYRDFIRKREQALAKGEEFLVYDYEQREGIECALWPHLYPFKEWCESCLDGSENRLSAKISFMRKVTSEIADYSMDFDLLHFHYDLWLWRTVTGAIAAGRKMKCSPNRALETKSFSTEYWRWQHRYLLDAVEQFGPPSLFITISPYEWSFPFPEWLESLRKQTGNGPTNLAGLELLHIVHVLEQLVRGYMCGSNTQAWTNNVFNYNRIKDMKNVQTYFYRFEFQERGTVHLHMLVCLKKAKQIRLDLIRGDIPWANMKLAKMVQELQKSDKGCLPETLDKTDVHIVDEREYLTLFHPADAFAENLRGYISTITPSLKCRMDVQSANGKGMLLKYAASYVSKWHDAFDNDSMFSVHVGPYEAAYRHLKCLRPLEPQMWMSLTSKKISWSQSRTKKLTVPLRDSIQPESHKAYCKRPEIESNLSFLEWLRLYDEKQKPPKKYKGGNTLVGCKLRSAYSDHYYFQQLVINLPHRKVSELLHPNDKELPEQIRNFAACWYHLDMWKDSKKVSEHFSLQGNKAHYVDTMVAFVRSRIDLLHLWQRKVIGALQSAPIENKYDLANLNEQQKQVVSLVDNFLSQREDSFNDIPEAIATSDNEDEADDNSEIVDTHTAVVKGHPGTGKSHALKAVISKCLTNDYAVAVATPTGFLQSTYRAEFIEDKFVADTIHSMFYYPVDTNKDKPRINWNIGDYQVLVIDEVSMVPTKIFKHIVSTLQQLHIRPVVILCGDQQQQSPIQSVGQTVQQTTSVLTNKDFYASCKVFHFKQQHRCLDPVYMGYLQTLRYFTPNPVLLQKLTENRILSDCNPPSEKDLLSVLKNHSESLVLTVSRKASAEVNKVALTKLFSSENALAEIQYDNDESPLPLYKDMKVIITQNRDKKNGVTNGQTASVLTTENTTVVLKLPNGNIVAIHPVTSIVDDKRHVCYPITPAYASTICKIQGQTLSKIVVWLDCKTVPNGAAYVALSRIRRLNDLLFLVMPESRQMKPIQILTE